MVVLFATVGYTADSVLPTLRSVPNISHVVIFYYEDRDGGVLDAVREAQRAMNALKVPSKRRRLKNGYDYTEVTREILGEARGVKDEEVVFDVTGGTKIMALGAFTAAWATRSRVYYNDERKPRERATSELPVAGLAAAHDASPMARTILIPLSTSTELDLEKICREVKRSPSVVVYHINRLESKGRQGFGLRGTAEGLPIPSHERARWRRLCSMSRPLPVIQLRGEEMNKVGQLRRTYLKDWELLSARKWAFNHGTGNPNQRKLIITSDPAENDLRPSPIDFQPDDPFEVLTSREPAARFWREFAGGGKRVAHHINSRVFITPAVKVSLTRGEGLPHGYPWKARSRAILAEELKIIKPDVVMTFGDRALQMLYDLDYRLYEGGSEVEEVWLKRDAGKVFTLEGNGLTRPATLYASTHWARAAANFPGGLERAWPFWLKASRALGLRP